MRNNDNKLPTRLIHSSLSYDKKFQKKKEIRKENLFNDIFQLNEEKEEETSEEEGSSSQINIILFYNNDKIVTKFNQNQTFAEYVKYLEQKYFRVGFQENYKIFYENKEIPMDDPRKINKIVRIVDGGAKFTLKAIKKAFLYSKMKKIYIKLENIPSFMDLSQQINNFINSQSEEINYDINYKDNSCCILFSSQEITFSFVAYMTNIKFTNKYYRTLKIDIKYNHLDKKRNKNNNGSRLLSEENKINNNKTIALESTLRNNKVIPSSSRNNDIKTYKSYNKMNIRTINYYNNDNSYDNDYYEDNYKSIRDSSPYEYEKELEKEKKKMDKKNWIGKKDFFTSVNKKSFNKLIRPKIKIYLKKPNIKALNTLNKMKIKQDKILEPKEKQIKENKDLTAYSNIFKFRKTKS